jgi:hypothetical protein
LVNMSKTDQFRGGHTILLAGCPDDPAICPIEWFKAYQQVRETAVTSFYKVWKGHGKMSSATPNHTLKKLVAGLGFDPDLFGADSARRGGATAALAGGIPVHAAKRHGNWRSDAVFAYVVDPVMVRLSVSQAISRSHLTHADFL